MEICSWVSFFVLLACPVFGQAAKRPLTTADYPLWSTLRNEAVSETGKWVSYGVSYESGADTVFVKSVDSDKILALPNTGNGRFVGDNMYCCLAGQQFRCYSLTRGTHWETDGVMRYEVSQDGGKVILICESDKKRSLQVRSLEGHLLESIDGIKSFSFNDDKSAIVYCKPGTDSMTAERLSLGNKLNTEILAVTQSGTFENFRWQTANAGLAFTHRENAKTDALYYHDGKSGKTMSCRPTLAGWNVEARYADQLLVSPDGKRIFFTMLKHKEPKSDIGSDVQVWNAKDRKIHSNRVLDDEQRRWMAWTIENNRITDITDIGKVFAGTTGDLRFAVYFTEGPYHASGTQYQSNDYFMLDTETGERRLLEKEMTTAPKHVKFGPIGSYMIYLKDGKWWFYDARSNKRMLIDSMRVKTASETDHPFTFAAWATDGKSLLFYDAFDIFEIAIGSLTSKRLTTGRESGTVYRLTDDNEVFEPNGATVKMYREDHDHSGFALLKHGKLKPIIWEKGRVSSLCSNADRTAFSIIREDWKSAPEIKRITGHKTTTVYKSNPHSVKYDWGKQELLRYDSSEGEPLYGVLCYPFGYDASKSYPMIVHLYERQTHYYHQYSNPSLLNTYGFNAAHLTALGYFVFFPDIAPKMGTPGAAATDCVIKGVDAVLASAPIDRQRIGLFGHSFGGYETSFIVTQTDMFRCAVSGSGISDYMSCYLTEDRAFHGDSFWRFEHAQRRTGVPFYENRQLYLDNSPVYLAKNIVTPLLQFTGEKDPQVPPSQSFELHLAMRRLGKENLLLVYPNEGHVLIRREHQADLTEKVTQWFGYYLKGHEKPEWTEPK